MSDPVIKQQRSITNAMLNSPMINKAWQRWFNDFAKLIGQKIDTLLGHENKVALISETGGIKSGEVGIRDGSTGYLVDETSDQSLSNKTLIEPVIEDFTDAQHDHSDDSEGGVLDNYNIDFNNIYYCPTDVTINDMVESIGTDSATLIISESKTLAASLMVPSTLKLVIEKGGMIVKASSYTLTINGPRDIGSYQVFSGFADGDVTFGTIPGGEVNPVWWQENSVPRTTDMGTAIQCAIDSVTGPATVNFPTNAYKITADLILKTRVNLFGNGSEIYRPSTATASNIMFSSYTSFIEDLTIAGFTLSSDNDRTGTGYYTGSMTSFVKGIQISGCKNLTIKDIICENLTTCYEFVVHHDYPTVVSENIYLENIACHDSRCGTHVVGGINHIYYENVFFDLYGGVDDRLHGFYIDGGVDDFHINNATVLNSPGGAVQIYNGYTGTYPAPSNGTISNLRAKYCHSAFYIYSGANNIDISNVVVSGCTWGFDISNISNVVCSSLTFDAMVDSTDRRIVIISSGTNVQFNNFVVDEGGLSNGGIVFYIGGAVDNVTVDGWSIIDCPQYDYIFYSANVAITNFEVKNSRIVQTLAGRYPINLPADNAIASFVNNVFINEGTEFTAVVNNAAPSGVNSVVVTGNSYSGFTNFVKPSDTSSKSFHNLNLTTFTYDDPQNIRESIYENIYYCPTGTTINAMVTAIGSTVSTLIITESKTLAAALSIPATLKLKIEKGGMLVKASTYGITFASQPEAGFYQIFSGFAVGDITGLSEAYVEWFGPNGTSDETATQLAIGNAPEVKFLKTLTLSSGLTISSAVVLESIKKDGYIVGTITIAADNVTLRNLKCNRVITGAVRDSITIEDCTIDQLSTGGTGTHAVYFAYPVSNLKIINSIITSSTATGIMLYADTRAPRTDAAVDNILISGNVIKSCSRHGINIIASKDDADTDTPIFLKVIIENNMIHDVGGSTDYHGIYLCGVSDFSITGNSIHTIGGHAIHLGNAYTYDHCTTRNGAIVGNSCYSNGVYGISLNGTCHAISITGNSLLENAWEGIYIKGTGDNINSDITISGNTIKGFTINGAVTIRAGQKGININGNIIDGGTPGDMYGVSLLSAEASIETHFNISVVGNTIRNARGFYMTGDASYASTVDGLIFSGNQIYTPASTYGISYDATYLTIQNVVIANNFFKQDSNTLRVQFPGRLTNASIHDNLAETTGGTYRLNDYSKGIATNYGTIAAGAMDSTIETGYTATIGDKLLYTDPGSGLSFGKVVVSTGPTVWNDIGLVQAGAVAGATKRKLTMRPSLVAGALSRSGKANPIVYPLGAHIYYELPIWDSGTNEYKELYFRDYIPGRWDGASDFTVYLIVLLHEAQDVGDYFKFQVSWENVATDGIFSTSTTDVVAEQAILTSHSAQYSSYLLSFTIDWDVRTLDCAASQHIGFRVRRVDATDPDVTTNGIGVVDSIVTYTVDRIFKAA